jgi:D-glycero-alpha-D-manno-heptose 1-phosphate guanylyltransferase
VVQAIVLAGGLGTRLRHIVPDLPKPMAPVAGRPFLAYILDQLDNQGFDSAVLSVGYRHEAIRGVFGQRFGRLSLAYAVEDRPLGTGGAIRLAARACGGTDVFVLNGDSYVEVEFARLQAAHRDAGASLTVCAVVVADTARYGRILIGDSQITGFAEKGATGSGLINAGVYSMRRDLLETLALPEVFSFEQDVLAAKLHAMRPRVHLVQGRFIDIGVPEDYARAQRLFGSTRTMGSA